jgi:hypothetical protein
MLLQGQVGVQTLADGSLPANLRLGKAGEAMASELQPRYYEQTYRGNMFSVANQAAVTTSTTLNTTFTGLSVANPVGSGVNLVITKFNCEQFAVGAAAVVSIAAGAGAAAGSLTIRNRLYAGAASKAVASAGATIAAPILIMPVGSVGSVATTAYGLQPGISVDLEGSLIIPPGYFVCTDTSIATTTALIFSFTWLEIPI